jgi:hypothetical protein
MTVYINGTTGYSGPVGVLGDLTTTGNTILGDQSTDTLNVANGNLVLNSSGNLGIGAANPTGRLEVAASSGEQLVLNDPASTGNGNKTVTITAFKSGVGFHNLLINAFDIRFATGGSITERVRIDSSGRLGIGTPTPVTNLTIGNGGGNDLGVMLSRGVTTNFYQAFDGTKTFIGGVDNTNAFAKVGTLSAHDLAIITANGSKIYIADSTGNVGVGTTSPASRLDVNGKITLRNGSDSRLGYIQNSGGALIIGSETSGTTELVFQTNGPTERARINSSGNLGVANTSPSYLVDIGSNSSANAHLRAQGGFLVRKYTVPENGTTGRTLRVTVALNGLQFTNFFIDASAHYFNNGGSWQAQRYAFQVMAEGGTLRHNIRMPNYEYGGSTSGVFTVGNPPSWTYVSDATWYFDFTVAGGFVSYITLSAAGPGIQNITLTVIS